MRILVFGGTRFLTHAIAAEAVRRGHEVACAARGESGSVPDGARLVRVDRDADVDSPDGLGALRGEAPFDAVVDPAHHSYTWVRQALEALGGGRPHWTFISSISVYADLRAPGQGVHSAVLDPVYETPEPLTPEGYGGAKVASEQAVRESGLPASIVRAGLIVGPGDDSDRFGYWPARFSRGGRVLVPADATDVPASWIDVRDLAEWIVDGAETGHTGTIDAQGPAVPLADLLDGIAAAVAPAGTEQVPVSAEFLSEHTVAPWMGARSLPFWLPASMRGIQQHDPEPARVAGLRQRPLADTAAASLAHERALGLDRQRTSGLSVAEEAELLAAWQGGGR